MARIMATIILAVSIAMAAEPSQSITAIEATETGVLVTYQDGTGYYYGR